ncbi:glycosyl transferase, group 2 family protein [Reinekea sp. MED297]|uniref:Glycosyl transferase, group 2 family protein n=2 Tax=Reinekea TaxID=230494 RepID=A4BIZ0_9GAMM|nr:glycosyl transferase, group 2 family protein [Reinekea sp. MED297] [Reinekea blandensis MED297]
MVLAPNALCVLGQAISRYDDALALYCDHVERSAWYRYAPSVKPAWSPDYYKAFDYIGPALWLQEAQFKAAALTPSEYLCSLPSGAVKHLPLPLVTTYGGTTKESSSRNDYSAEYTNTGTVSVIIPTRNAVHLLKPCVESVRRTVGNLDVELIVIDNQSDCENTLGYLHELSTQPNTRVLRYNQPFNFSAMNNFAVREAKGEVVCLLNNDTEAISNGWLESLVHSALQPGVGCVGAKLYYPDGRVQHAGVVLGFGGGADHAFKFASNHESGYMNRLVTPQNYLAVTAACLAVRKSVFLEVGGLDEQLTVAFNDVDFCLRVVDAGYRNVWLPQAQMLHHESPSRGADDTPEKSARFQQELTILKQRWERYIANDPAYSPWLAKTRHDFAFRRDSIGLSAASLR